MSDALSQLAEATGLILDWEDIQGTPRRVAPDAVRAILTALGHPCASEGECRDSLAALRDAPPPALQVVIAGEPLDLPPGLPVRLTLESGERRDLARGRDGRVRAPDDLGYHMVEVGDRTLPFAVCPPRCLTPKDRLGRRAWGLTVQIYSLAGDGAFGDFGDLARFAEAAGAAGADALAISPVHALFAADPARYSPYSPSSRDHLNGLLAPLEGAGAAATPLIDWLTAAPAKLAALQARLPDLRADPDFEAFVAEGGEDLRRHALFEALHEWFGGRGQGDWRAWPAEFRDPAAAEANLTLGLRDKLEFHLLLQWLAQAGLAEAQAAARRAGMDLGLVTDLAVGMDPAGSHAWARPDELLTGLTLGAPPDAFQADGQGWGITTFAPEALRRTGFAPFLKTLRAALRHAGGVRIDHALGLKRLWVLPEGASPLEGAYLKQPFEDLLRLIALESHRAQAVVIGEDLGVVPPGLRDTLQAHGLLGMRVLPFERLKDGGFRAPGDYDPLAAAMTSTHDLPPVAGWWTGVDIAWRERLGGTGRADEEVERDAARDAFWRTATDAGVAAEPPPAQDNPPPVVDAAVALTAATPCELLLLPVEDLLGLEDQVNMPGVVETHPNWRRRLPLAAGEMFAQPQVEHRLALLKSARPR